MDCIECARKIEKAVKEIDGVKQVRISYTTGRLNVEVENGKVPEQDIERSLNRLGYKVGKSELGLGEFFSLKNRHLMTTVISGILFALGFLTERTGQVEVVYLSLYLAAIVTGGYHIARRGTASIMELYLDMNSF